MKKRGGKGKTEECVTKSERSKGKEITDAIAKRKGVKTRGKEKYR